MKSRFGLNLFVILGLLAALVAPSLIALADPRIYYVTDSGTGDCLSWGTACKLQTALGLAIGGDDIWVAAGSHTPDTLTPGDRNAAFQLRNGVAIYGGFNGTETQREDRDWNANPTILSGDIGTAGDNSDNSYHVVSSDGSDATAVLDGFTILYGNANGTNGVEMFGGGMYLKSSSPTLSNLRFEDNLAAQDGGGLYNVDSSPALVDVVFENNEADFNGGGIFNLDSSPTLENVDVYSNDAGGDGGGMYNENSNLILDTVAFWYNDAGGDGGGMFNNTSNPTLEDVDFFSNDAGSDGGGMYNNTSSPALAGVLFENNWADFDGGGMYNESSSPSLENVVFDENWADNGSGMYNLDSSPTLANVEFWYNQAWDDGGGMYNESSSPSLDKVVFDENWADNGSGMYNLDSSPALANVEFWYNVAWNDGGGMYNDFSSPTLANVEFWYNQAGDDGGGIFNTTSSPELANVTFNGNEADDVGGGMFFDNSAAMLANIRYYDNLADWGGGMTVFNNSHVSVYNATFNANDATSGDGGGIWLGIGSSLYVYNSILWDNTATGDGDQYWGHVTFNSNPINLVQDGCIPYLCIDADPEFVDAAAGNLRIQLSSPAVDAGDNGALPQDQLDLDGDVNSTEVLPVDLAGYPRIANGVVDLGAYESPPARIYVDQDAVGLADGSSWTDAFTDLQRALGWAIDGVEIWVAEGTYLPTADIDRDDSFELIYKYALYGGFAGSETLLSERDWAANPTYLSGNIGDPNNNADNSYHVVTIFVPATLDGFIITGGNANNSHDWGGGMYIEDSNPTLANLTFLANYAHYGGGLYSEDSSPEISDVTFSYNTAGEMGGGMFIEDGSPLMTDAIFISNRARFAAGGVLLESGNLEIANGVFWYNSTSFQGGAMYLGDGDLALINVSFSHNEANLGAAIFNNSADLALTNSIVWDNFSSGAVSNLEGQAEISYSLVENGCPPMATCDHATNLYGIDPLFVDAADGNLRLQPADSPAIDVGDNSAVPVRVTTDLDGNPRFVELKGGGAIVDMGAYEAQNIAPIATDDSYLTLEDQPLVKSDPDEGLLANDLDANGDALIAELDLGPSHGVLVLAPDGTFTYTPNAGFNGQDSFTYYASDGRLDSNLAMVTIWVREVNHAPLAVADNYETHRNVPLAITDVTKGVLNNDSDPDGDALSAILDVYPLHGHVVLSPDGTFIYVPHENYAGTDQFTYHAYDNLDSSVTAMVTIEVLNTPPTGEPDAYEIDKNRTLLITSPDEGLLANDHDGDGDHLTAILKLEPRSGDLTLNPDGTFTYIPAVSFSGLDSFTYFASDGVDRSDTVSVRITVLNHRPMAAADNYATMVNTPLRIDDPTLGLLANDSDPDGDEVRAILLDEPAGDLVLYSNGIFSYTPPVNFAGNDRFTYYVTDRDQDSDPVEVSILVFVGNERVWLPMVKR